jgi:hypothetical protein
MTTKVTKESLAENIGRLESYGDLSLNEEYQLKAYRLLAVYMREEEILQSVADMNHEAIIKGWYGK